MRYGQPTRAGFPTERSNITDKTKNLTIKKTFQQDEITRRKSGRRNRRSRGIGKAIAIQFAKEGANVAFTDLAIDENGKKTEEELNALGVKAKGYASNAANFEDTHKVIDQIMQDFGRIDILVNNAGITKDG